MKKTKYYIVVIILCLLVSCKKEYIKYVYFSSGKVKEKVIFPTKGDKKTRLNYTVTTYYENGQVHVIETIENRLTEGACIVYQENGLMDHFKMYRHDTLHGVYKEYSSEGIQVGEALYLTGERIIDVKIYKEGGNLLYVYYLKVGEHGYIPFSQFAYDDNGLLIEQESTGCEVIGKDTIQEGELYSLEIVSHTGGEAMPFTTEMRKAIFGNYDSSLVVDSSFVTVTAIRKDKIHYSFQPLKKGYNFVVGKVYRRREDDGVTLMHPIYKLFYVKGKDEK